MKKISATVLALVFVFAFSLIAFAQSVSTAVLPNTGGIGTTIFYIAGGILLVGACVILIAKKFTSK